MKVFVGNLAWTVNEEELWSFFEDFGDVTSATVVTDGVTGNSCGYGFVEFSSDDHAWAAIEALDGTEFHGQVVTVAESSTCDSTVGFTTGNPPTGGTGGTGDNGGSW